ncbi:MAG: hypothetical protein DYG94_02455 [Leptolyngbya sp. PLA3]|nr:MAG: hypothetical protein EDM82_02100 [Cyanobacteria bacterium CYA]MCE7967591.1 hypothetical protein [Leptolyngbya sp. PL-A3]
MTPKPITIIEPGMLEAPEYVFEVNWWMVGPLGVAMLSAAAAICLLRRARLRCSVGELATQALVRGAGLDRKTRRALWRVADRLDMRERAGVLLMSRSALLTAVGQLAMKAGDKKTTAAATRLVERLIGPVKSAGRSGQN